MPPLEITTSESRGVPSLIAVIRSITWEPPPAQLGVHPCMTKPTSAPIAHTFTPFMAFLQQLVLTSGSA
jgi:hypothetical protein